MTSTPPSAAGIQDAARHLAEARPTEAVAVLERLVADFPVYVTAHVLLAKAYEASGRDGEALEAWHHAYFLMPGSPLVVRERTRLLRTAPVVAEPEEGPVLAELSDSGEDGGGDRRTEEPRGEAHESAVAAVSYGEAKPESAVEESPTSEPEPALEPEPTLGEVDDLDTLIHQLETAPRIQPDPDFRDEGFEEEEDEEGLVSETLARIYAAQKQYAAAARAYDRLAEQQPERADEFAAKAADMRDLAGGA